MGALKFLSSSNLFLGQSKAFFAYLTDLAEDADEAGACSGPAKWFVSYNTPRRG
jgi:hypothetical protein